ncbi:MAG: deoxynucleoside kinase [Anaerolineales bacterium]|nr:deoxynucleoside kinase [Anaerolineae bacterium]PWB51971.1 MAG: deoxynucleoside kinase [Anaerolineales bacterium]
MYLAIEGVIGVGKTTLARLLQPAFQSALVLEVFEENPFLSDFYSDRQRYAFQTQIFFLLSRYYQQRRSVPEIIRRGESLITDYTFTKDALFARINLAGDELDMYYRVHDALAEKIPLPNLIIYLRADLEVLMQRIASRDRPYERNIERGYIEELCSAYDAFFLENQARNIGESVTVLILDTNELDYVRRPEDLKLVENRIRQTLKQVPFQATLPMIDEL